MRKFLFFFLFALLPLASSAQKLTVKVDSVGQLASKLPDSLRYSMSELKIKGPLNGSDLRLLQTLAGRLKPKRAGNHQLQVLDLSEASIPEGKGMFRNKANVLPSALFLNSKDLEYVILPTTLTEIGRSCFSGCINLKKIELPETLKLIGEYAFSGCQNLTEVTLPSELETINGHAFEGCEAIICIDIPEKVTKIELFAFTNCKMLETVNIEAQINRVNNALFAGCERLKSITLPQSVNYIGMEAFKDCGQRI